MQEKNIHIRLLQYIDKVDFSETEEKQILQWIGKSEENRKYFEMLKQLSGEKSYLERLKKIDLDKNFQRFRSQMDQLRANPKPGTSQGLHLATNYLMRIAAVFMILLLGAAGLYLVRTERTAYVREVTASHEKTSIRLSDGSLIELNKGSQILYPEKSGLRKREVGLKGEAYFEVTKKKYTSFCVNMENTSVKVLGTSFNIRESENGEVQVNVLSGKVSFSERSNPENTILLEAGERGVFDPKSRKFVQASWSSENFLYWKTGKLSFVEQALSDVFNDLELCFLVKFVVKDQKILENRFTSECTGDRLEDILNELALIFSLEYHQQDNTIYIYKR